MCYIVNQLYIYSGPYTPSDFVFVKMLVCSRVKSKIAIHYHPILSTMDF